MEIIEAPYYSELDSVYHALPSCPNGRRIPAEIRRTGKGGRFTMCPACEARVEAALSRGRDGDVRGGGPAAWESRERLHCSRHQQREPAPA